MAQVRLGRAVAMGGQLGKLLGGLLHDAIGDQRQGKQHHRPDQCRDAQPDMKGEQDAQKE